jgi:hypothetical protein
MKTFKFLTNNEPNYLEEVPTISRYDDYDDIVLNRIRYETSPVGKQYHFAMVGENKTIIISNITHNDNNLPLMETVTIEYELYHIYLNQPDRVETRHITMSLDMYNEIRYETV